MTETPISPKRRRVQCHFYGESKVEQNHKNRCDINSIVSKAMRTGLLPSRGNAGHYGDFTEVTDYRTACDALLAAEDTFMALPAAVRKRFSNSPEALLVFLSDDENRDEAIELGILPQPEPITPEPEPIVPEPDLEPSE